MIKYRLRCESKYCSEKKDFDGWFQNIEAFQKQMVSGLINCPICGSDNVIKLLAVSTFTSAYNALGYKKITLSWDVIALNIVFDTYMVSAMHYRYMLSCYVVLPL